MSDFSNKACGVCGKKYHCCSSCDIWPDYYLYNYCSKECFQKSGPYIEARGLYQDVRSLCDQGGFINRFDLMMDTLVGDDCLVRDIGLWREEKK